MNNEEVIVLHNLSKRYDSSPKLALNNVSLTVHKGEVYGFLGANGAGKSTTIRTLLNFIQPTDGHATIFGEDIVKGSTKIRENIGYLAGDVALYNKLTGKQFLKYMASLQPLKDPSYLKQLSHQFEAELNKPISSLSKGNRQKIGLLQAFMHQPDVLILDEPTSGLDPLMQEVCFEAVRDAKKRGACIFFSSHNLAEVQRICDRVGFIREGRLIREQSLAELAASAAHTFDLVFIDKAPLDELRTIPKAHVHRGEQPNTVAIAVPAEQLSRLFAVLAKHHVQHFQQREVNLEEEFLSFYRESSHEK